MLGRIVFGVLVAVAAGFLAWRFLNEQIKAWTDEHLPWHLVARWVYDCRAVDEAIAKYDDWDQRTMRAIARAESKCDVNALGDTDLTFEEDGRIYGYSVGAMQVRILPGREHCDTFDVAKNVECANWIYGEQGLGAWSVWRDGRYERYLEPE